MSNDLWHAEPFGASWHEAAPRGWLSFNLHSHGDRVSGRVSPSSAAPGALVLVAGPSGRAEDPWADAAARAWASWACVASIDLPLCGARTSEKLSGLVRGENTPGTARLLDELCRQALRDLARAAELIATRQQISGAFGFAGVGIGARLCSGIEDHGASAAVLDAAIASEAPDPTWLRRAGEALLGRLGGADVQGE